MKTVVVIGSNSFSGSDFVDYLLDETSYNVVGHQPLAGEIGSIPAL